MILVPGKLRIALLPCLLMAASGCVSSSLESSDFRPVGSKPATVSSAASSDPVALTPAVKENDLPTSTASSDPAEEDGVDEAARQAAIAEMRAKGQQTSGEKTVIGALPETAASQLTPAERQQKAAEMAKKVREANAEVTDNEVASKQASIRRLQQKAKSHYDSAIRSIEN